MTCSSGTKRSPSGSSTNRGSSDGTFTRAKRRSSDSGSRTITARFSDRFEMYGNGWPGSTASGVSTGKMRCSNTSTRYLRSSSSSSSQREQLDADLAQRRHELARGRAPPGAGDQLGDPVADLDRAAAPGVRPSGRGPHDAGRHLVLQAGHPHLEELVEVLAEDGAELHPLEQRDGGLVGQREDPRVEVEPGQLAVQDPLVDVRRERHRRGGHGHNRTRGSRQAGHRIGVASSRRVSGRWRRRQRRQRERVAAHGHHAGDVERVELVRREHPHLRPTGAGSRPARRPRCSVCRAVLATAPGASLTAVSGSRSRGWPAGRSERPTRRAATRPGSRRPSRCGC